MMHDRIFDISNGATVVYASLELVKQLAPSAALTILTVAYDARLKEHRFNVADLAERFPAAGVDVATAIPARIAVAEAVANGRTIWEHHAPSLAMVRSAYSLLMGRVLALAGQATRSEAEILETGANHGSNT